MTDPIIKQDVRVLRPSEFEQLQGILKPIEKAQINGLLATCARYEEGRRIQAHPEWFDGYFVNMRKIEGVKEKAKMKLKERSIRLSNFGRKSLPIFLKKESKLPSRQWFDPLVKKWGKEAGLDPIGLCCKTFRKTGESWQAVSYPDKLTFIVMSVGHTKEVSVQHYLNYQFRPNDIQAMKPYVKGLF